MIEVLLVVAVIGILASMVSIAYPRIKERAEGVTCMTQMKVLGGSLGAYLTENNRWPQLPEASYADDTAAAKFWIDSLRDYGMSEEKWTCPSLTRNLGIDFEKAELGDKVSYHPTPFDSLPGTPTRNHTMPWAIEAGGDHPDGQNILFMDGRVVSGQNMR